MDTDFAHPTPRAILSRPTGFRRAEAASATQAGASRGEGDLRIRIRQWFIYSSCRVGRNRISFTSTSSGWLMAKTTARAKESAGIAVSA